MQDLGIPEYMIEDAEELQDAINYETKDNRAISPKRPYDGQPHTFTGDRGKTVVEGLSIRDICDCFVLGLLDASAYDVEEISEKLQHGTACYNDVYLIPDCIDPIAAVQNAALRIEGMMEDS